MARLFDDASSEYLERGDACGISAYPVTMACWFYGDDNSVNIVMMSLGNTVGTGVLHLMVRNPPDSDLLAFAENDSAVSAFALTSTDWSVNIWHHGTVVFASATDRRVFLDGGGKGTNATNIAWGTQNRTEIGSRRRDNVNEAFFSGSIAEAGIWNIALTDAEAAILAAGYSPLFVQPQNLVAYWPLVRGLTDPVGGYDMTASGTTVSAHPRIIRPVMPMLGLHIAAAGVNRIPIIDHHNRMMAMMGS